MKTIFGIIVVFGILSITLQAKSFQKPIESGFGEVNQKYMEMTKLRDHQIEPLLFRMRRSPQVPDVPVPIPDPSGLPPPPVPPM